MSTMYLKSGGGNWSAAATWSATGSGGVDSVGPPAAANDCVAETGSGALTIDAGAICRSFDTTSGAGNYGGTITHSSVMWTIGDGTAGVGNVALKLNSGVTYTLSNPSLSAVSFVSTSGTQQTIDFGGKNAGSITINGAGSSYQLTSNITMAGNTSSWVYTAGSSFDANSHTITLSSLNTSGTQFVGGGKTYYGLVLTYNGFITPSISGANTFTNLTVTGKNGPSCGIKLSADQTVTGTNMPTFAGNSVTNRLLITSDVRGTQRTITNTSTTPAITNADFEDIAFNSAVDLSAISGKSGNCGGNSGITFTTAINPLYWNSAVDANESDSTKWFLGTGGSGGAGRVALPQDSAIFEMTAGGKTITLDMPRHGALSFAGIANTPSLTNNTAATHYGSLTLDSGLGTYSGTALLTFSTRGSISILSTGKTFTNSFVSDAPGGTVTLADAFVQTGTSGWVHTQGTHAVSNVSTTYVLYSSGNGNIRTITQGSVTPILTGNATAIWACAALTNCTFTTRPSITCNYSGATGTRTIQHGSTLGTEANAIDVNVTSGTDIVTTSSNNIMHSLNFTGFAGTWTNSANSLYGNLTLGTGMTITAGVSVLSLLATSGTQVITSNTKNLDRPITINCPGATVQLADSLSQGTSTSRTVTWTAGTIDLQSFTWTHFGTWSLSSTGVRILSGTGTLALSLDTASTLWTYSGSNFSVSGTPTIKIIAGTANTRTFAGGGATYGNLWYTNATGGQLTLSGNNTFADIRCNDGVTQSLIFTAASNTTYSTFTVTGASSHLVTLGSTTTGTYTLTRAGGGVTSCDYLSISHCLHVPGNAYAGTHSTNGQGTTTAGSGWVFNISPLPNVAVQITNQSMRRASTH